MKCYVYNNHVTYRTKSHQKTAEKGKIHKSFTGHIKIGHFCQEYADFKIILYFYIIKNTQQT